MSRSRLLLPTSHVATYKERRKWKSTEQTWTSLDGHLDNETGCLKERVLPNWASTDPATRGEILLIFVALLSSHFHIQQ